MAPDEKISLGICLLSYTLANAGLLRKCTHAVHPRSIDIRKKANALRQNGVWVCQIVASEEWKRYVNLHRLSHPDVISMISLHTTY